MMQTFVRPSRDLRNHYAELSEMLKDHNHVIITNHGRGESVLIRTNRITISAGASGLLLSFCSAAVSGIMSQKASFIKTFCHKLPDFT